MRYSFILIDNIILVEVLIEGLEVEKILMFVLDTGASGSSINKEALSNLNINYEDLDYVEDSVGISGRIETKILEVPSLSLFGKTEHSYELCVIDYPAEVGYLAEGILGMDFLLKFDILKIDFENEFIEITDTGKDWTNPKEC